MTVKELKELLKGLPDQMEVIVQKDSEGNGYSPLCGADPNAVYVPQNTWSGEMYATDWSADDACMEEDEWAELMKKPRCLVLHPVN